MILTAKLDLRLGSQVQPLWSEALPKLNIYHHLSTSSEASPTFPTVSPKVFGISSHKSI